MDLLWWHPSDCYHQGGTSMRHIFGTVIVTITVLIGIFLFAAFRSSTERLSTLDEHTSSPIERRVSFAPVPTWTRVSHDAQSVPTNTPLLPTDAPPTALPPTSTIVPPTTTPQPATLTGYGNINVRIGPGTEYDIAQRLTAGRSYQIVAKNFNGRWWEIDLSPESPIYSTGWVFADLVDANNIEYVSVSYNIPNTPTPIPVLGHIEYRELFRNIENYRGDSFRFKGQVMQVEEYHGDFYLMVNVTWNGYYWDDQVWLNYYDATTRILEEDIVEFVGEVNGLYKYRTVRGDVRDIPELYVHELHVVQ